MTFRRLAVLTILFAAAALSACAKRTRPPGDPQVCYYLTGKQADGSLKYNKVSTNVPNLETCAANLEAMRIRFLRMGGSRVEIVGAYQGNFLFLQREGIFTSPSLEQGRYLALIRTGDGRLAMPGAVQQPQ